MRQHGTPTGTRACARLHKLLPAGERSEPDAALLEELITPPYERIVPLAFLL
jgi:hypothetical protein